MEIDESLTHVHCRSKPAFVDREVDVVSIYGFHQPEVIGTCSLCFFSGKLFRIGTDAAARVVDAFLQLRVIAVKGVELLTLDVSLQSLERVGHSFRSKTGGCSSLQSFHVGLFLLFATVAEHADGEHEW